MLLPTSSAALSALTVKDEQEAVCLAVWALVAISVPVETVWLEMATAWSARFATAATAWLAMALPFSACLSLSVLPPLMSFPGNRP